MALILNWACSPRYVLRGRLEYCALDRRLMSGQKARYGRRRLMSGQSNHTLLIKIRLATSGFEMCFGYQIPAPWVPGPNGPNQNTSRIQHTDSVM